MINSLTIFTDGGSRGNPGAAAVGVTVQDQTGAIVWETGQTIGVGTNNEAEYLAIKTSLEWLQTWDQTASLLSITWKLDSKLVVEQLSRRWKIKEPRMLVFAQQCWQLFDQLPCPYTLVHIPREQNKRADALVNQALDQAK